MQQIVTVIRGRVAGQGDENFAMVFVCISEKRWRIGYGKKILVAVIHTFVAIQGIKACQATDDYSIFVENAFCAL